MTKVTSKCSFCNELTDEKTCPQCEVVELVTQSLEKPHAVIRIIGQIYQNASMPPPLNLIGPSGLRRAHD
jgi:hypothetical protein